MPLFKNTLQKYPADNFVETGTFQGEGITFALQYGYKNIHSVEYHAGVAQDAMNKFRDEPRVTVWQGNSGDILSKIIPKLQGSIVFWLDAHMESNLTESNCPIMKELEAIRPLLKTRKVTILIDDWRLMSNKLKESVLLYVTEVQAPVKSAFIDSPVACNDILKITSW